MIFVTSIVVGALIVYFFFRNRNNRKMVQFKVPLPEEANANWNPTRVLESPSIHTPHDPTLLTCYDPATGGFLGHVQKHTKQDVSLMLERARLAQAEWALTSFEDRRAVLESLSEFILSHQQDIAAVASRDSGKTFVDAFFGEILTTLEKINWVCKHGESVLQPEYRSVGTLTMHKQARVEYHPLGVVAAIVSWNYPFHNAFGPIISALFAGNAILIKSSEHVAWSTTQYFERIIKECLRAHGRPTDLVQFVVGEGDIGEALVKSGVDKVTFIGSPGVGKKVMAAASDNLTPVVLELGGKDAAVICEDADLNQVVPIVMRGTYQNVGQNCIGLERIIVHKSIHDVFLERVKALVSQLRQGPPLSNSTEVDCGAMTMSSQIAHIQRLVDDAVAQGASLVCGGQPSSSKGQFYPPTVLTNIKPSMRIAQEEVFGPVMTIMTFESDAEAIDIVNSSPYGLGGSVFSNTIPRAERMMAQMRTGMGNINDFAVNYLCQSLPFGGVKASGFGRFAGVEGLRGECAVRAITCDKFAGVKTHIPPVLDYPISKEKSVVFCESLARMAYGPSIKDRILGVFELAKVSLMK